MEGQSCSDGLPQCEQASRRDSLHFRVHCVSLPLHSPEHPPWCFWDHLIKLYIDISASSTID